MNTAADRSKQADTNTDRGTSPARRSTPARSDDLGRRVLGRLSESLGRDRVQRLLGAHATLRLTEGSLEVSVADRFSAEMVERRLGDDLRRWVAEEAPGDALSVRVRVEDPSPTYDARGEASPPTSPDESDTPLPAAPRSESRRTAPRQAVPEYIVGQPNRIAYEAVRRAAVETSPAFVFVHGPCGVGKTHLLRLAGAMARRAQPNARVRWTSGESFVGGYVAAVRTGALDAFQKKHRRIDLLIIDDVHIIAGKEGSQQELVRTLNDLHLTGARVILASDAHPRDIARLQEALSSRFVSGVVAPVGRPDHDMARRLIPALAKRRGLVLDPQAHELLAQRVAEDGLATVRDIEGVLTQVQAVANLMDRDRALFLSAEHVRQAVEMRAGARAGVRAGPVSIDRIIDTVCRELGVTRDDLGDKGRSKKVVLARELVVHLGKRHTGRSYPELAMALGRPNHSTVITAHQRFQDRLTDAQPVQVGASVDGCPAAEIVSRMERAMGI